MSDTKEKHFYRDGVEAGRFELGDVRSIDADKEVSKALHLTLVELTMRLKLIDVDNEALGLDLRQHRQHASIDRVCSSPHHHRC